MTGWNDHRSSRIRSRIVSGTTTAGLHGRFGRPGFCGKSVSRSTLTLDRADTVVPQPSREVRTVRVLLDHVPYPARLRGGTRAITASIGDRFAPVMRFRVCRSTLGLAIAAVTKDRVAAGPAAAI